MTMKSIITLTLVGLIAVSAAGPVMAQSPKMKMTTPIPESITAPDKVTTSIGTLEYFDGVPKEKTVEAVCPPAPPGSGEQLAADRAWQELVHRPSLVRSAAALDRPDLAAG